MSSASPQRVVNLASRYPNALVIGATGMLRQAAITIAKQSNRFTAVARTLASLKDLDRDLQPGERWLLPLNWDQPELFLSSLEQHVQAIGRPTLVVAWLHDEPLGARIARLFYRVA